VEIVRILTSFLRFQTSTFRLPRQSYPVVADLNKLRVIVLMREIAAGAPSLPTLSPGDLDNVDDFSVQEIEINRASETLGG
jgi:hypothetical protein